MSLNFVTFKQKNICSCSQYSYLVLKMVAKLAYVMVPIWGCGQSQVRQGEENSVKRGHGAYLSEEMGGNLGERLGALNGMVSEVI